ncbi:serine/threonine-protein kinase [Angustibacter sp. McL0619]|uniref:serine/threonine-protein kinase n=1 Tax=Angustibacter sp. McL0619 TaxID=3415676 RepID=UPI003CF0BC72
MAMGERVAEQSTRIGPYRVHGRLGEGGMGVVHLGLDRAGRAVAIKVLRPHVAHDPEARARLAREVSTLRRVRHPLVAEVLDADLEGPQPYLVTRFVPGSGLDAVVREHGALSAPQLLRLGLGLSSALGAIHAANVVHRDLKPGNVLVLDGDPVVIDFGIAHVADDIRLTSTGLVMGTPGYLSPEVIDGGRVTEATDWWGWAATLTFAASGRPPFGRGPMDVVIDRVRRGQADLDGVDERLRPLLAAALSADPARRPGHGEVLEALDRYASGEPATATLALLPGSTRVLPEALPAAPTAVRPAPVPAALAATAPPPYAAPIPSAAPPRTYVNAHGEPDVDPDVTPAGRRPMVVAGLLLALVAGALVAPVVCAAVVAALCVLARMVERNRFSLARRRYERGPRRSDAWVATVSSPWHLVRSVLVTALASIQPVLLGVATAFCVGLVLPMSDGSAHPASLPAVGAAAAIALLTAWWGPGGGSLRRGTSTTLRVLVPSRHRWTWALVLLVVAGGLAWTAVNAGEPLWWPVRHAPFGLLS